MHKDKTGDQSVLHNSVLKIEIASSVKGLVKITAFTLDWGAMLHSIHVTIGRWSEISDVTIAESVTRSAKLVKVLSIRVAVDEVILVGLSIMGRR